MFLAKLKYLILSIIVQPFLPDLTIAQTINDLIPRDESFYIQSALNYGHDKNGFWDIPGNSPILRERSRLIVTELLQPENDRKYAVRRSTVTGFIKIHIDGIAGFLDYIGRSDSNGVRLVFNRPSDAGNQDFTLRYTGYGRFKIYNRNGKVVTLENRSSDSGMTLILWDDNDGPWTEWVLISTTSGKPLLLDDLIAERRKKIGEDMTGVGTVYIQSALNYGKNANGFLCLPGNGTMLKESKVQAGDLNDTYREYRFNIIQSSSDFAYYNLTPKEAGNLVLSTEAGSEALVPDEPDISKTQNFYFRYRGNGKLKIFSQDGRVLSIKNNPGMQGETVQLTEDAEGLKAEWYLIDAERNEVVLPAGRTEDIKSVSKFNSEGEDKISGTFGLIDETFESIKTLQASTLRTFAKVSSLQNTINEAYSLTLNIDKLIKRIDNTSSAIVPLSQIPTIGLALKPLTMTLDFSRKQLVNVSSGISAFKGPVIDPVNNNISFAFSRVMTVKNQLNLLKQSLFDIKRSIYETALAGDFDKAQLLAVQVAGQVKSLKFSLSLVQSALRQVDNLCDLLNKIQSPAGKVNDGLREFEKKYREIDKIADEINEVLDRRLIREFAGVKLDVSLREVLNGVNISKAAEGYVQNWADELMRPLFEKFNIKMPELPGISEFRAVLTESLDLTGRIREEGVGVAKITDAIASEIDAMITLAEYR